jgi:predicted anti-sigma-YlaC factor YlaD
MKRLRLLSPACKSARAAWPAYAEAHLRGAAASAPYQLVRAHLAACPVCAAEFAALLALFTWREAQTPFNAGSLPLAVMQLPGSARSAP